MTSIADRGAATPPTHPDVTADELVARAAALVPILIEQQAETEARTFYAEETHRAFLDAGLYRVTQPRRYGGYEFGIGTFARIAATLARGCPSTAWCWGFGVGHTMAMASYWGEQAQDDVFANGLFICPSTAKPQGSAKKVDGGWLINGTFNYCSGAPYATHFWSHTFPETPDGSFAPPLTFVISADQFQRLDDWGGQLGLKGSGSHSLKIEDGFVPDYRVKENTTLLSLRPDADGTTVGSRLHNNPVYATSAIRWFLMEIFSVAAGTIRGAQDEYGDLMQKVTPFPPPMPRKEHPDYQLWYGQGAAKVAVVEALLRDCCYEIDTSGTTGRQSLADDMRILSIAFQGLGIGWDALQGYFFRSAGSSQIRNGTRTERIWRDYSQMHTHSVNLMSTNAYRDVALEDFGIDLPFLPGMSMRPPAAPDPVPPTA
ncbi:acyl-CoA dehydrogenase family protein [Mycobacterium intracellulare]|uniref:acyl-CoA dehydrogenase family protein n=1 Tax=Mycobacterium intracellulare TaxID=1767 RepID=UPI001CD9202C|nr:acyl-CoA dehydrogenase family protein [Mycobacterium intracellulare]MCA2277111.1 acyl-CoA dehydrogenase family protein [Mycobacterium intracellulare]MCA2328715.1 acyl-CoA dehydrogenase family protein [Mycobacterium intracellulare]